MQDVKYASEDGVGWGGGINGIPLELLIFFTLQRGSFCFLPHLPGISLLRPAGCLLSLQPTTGPDLRPVVTPTDRDVPQNHDTPHTYNG